MVAGAPEDAYIKLVHASRGDFVVAVFEAAGFEGGVFAAAGRGGG
jgi:hypothetical protein